MRRSQGTTVTMGVAMPMVAAVLAGHDLTIRSEQVSVPASDHPRSSGDGRGPSGDGRGPGGRG